MIIFLIFFLFDFSGSVKIEIKPFNPTGSVDKADATGNRNNEDEEDDSSKYRDENWKEKLRREPFKPLMDPEVVKEFLLGDYCLHGGTGWWKYEFCYGNKIGPLTVRINRSWGWGLFMHRDTVIWKSLDCE